MNDTCVWRLEEIDSDLWETACKQEFIMLGGTPSDNDMKYCCYCGKPIEEIEE